jgi:hypothetical protein
MSVRRIFKANFFIGVEPIWFVISKVEKNTPRLE